MRILANAHGRICALALSFTLFTGSVALATDPASVVVVFDGSGSMWGNLDGSRLSKFVVARLGLRRALATVGPQTRIGLAAFGHRRGDCGDVELLRPVEPLDVDKTMAPLERLNPRGKGPLTTALREAAKSLGWSIGKRSLVLIHDDADNCQQDVCALANELREAKLSVHVVGVGLKPEDATKMACLPQVTGGRLFNAQSEEQVGSAIEEALRYASTDSGGRELMPTPAPPPPPPPVAAAPPPRRAAQIPGDAPPGLYLQAVLTANGELTSAPMHWTVFAEGRPEVALFDARITSPFVPAPAGRYIVETRDGAVSARQNVEVGDKGPTVVNLVLNAGTLRVRALAQKSGATLNDALITISDAGQGNENKKDGAAAAPVALFKGGEAVALLSAGRYTVRAEQGTVRTERAVVVPAGSQGRIDIPLNGGRVQLAATLSDGGALDAPVFSIVEDDPDAPKGRREVARSAARQADFILPPGTYHAVVRQGTMEARERFALSSGDVLKRTLSLSAGRLTLGSRLAGGELSPAEPLSYRLERLDASPPETWTTSRPAPVMLVPPGRYRIEGRYGMMNARTVREIDVKAGQAQQLTLEHQAASLNLRLKGAGGVASADVFWVIRDSSGYAVWTTGQAEPAATLQAGRYRVRAETREKNYEQTVEVRSGEPKRVELTAD